MVKDFLQFEGYLPETRIKLKSLVIALQVTTPLTAALSFVEYPSEMEEDPDFIACDRCGTISLVPFFRYHSNTMIDTVTEDSDEKILEIPAPKNKPVENDSKPDISTMTHIYFDIEATGLALKVGQVEEEEAEVVEAIPINITYCVVYGCNSNSNSRCDKNIYWFTFPKDSQRNRAWVHYCKRQDFTPSKHSRICSKHFTLNQYSRHPERLSELGYPGAKAALKDDAMPDIPVVVDAEKGPSSPKKPRSAFEKRQKRQVQLILFIIHRNFCEKYVLQEAFNESLDKSVDSIDTETESPPAPDSMEIQEEVEIPVDVPKTFEAKSFNTDYTNMKIQKNQTDPILQRTRRNQTLKPKRKSKVIQCINPSDIDSASKVATSKTRTIIGNITSSSLAPAATGQNLDDNDEIDDDEDDVDEYDNDSDYIYNESEEEDGDDEYGSDDEEETSNYRMEECNDPVEEKYYMVFETALFQLLSVCRECNNRCIPIIEFSRGTMISTSSVCAFGHVYKWKSQNCHERLPWGNLLFVSAIMFSGNNTAKIVRLFDQMKLKGIRERSVRRLQTAYTSCAVIYEFDSQQADLIASLCPDKQVVLGGDGRCDSPGYSAKYGSYTLMDLNTNKILDIQLVQKFMKDNHPEINHYYDVWHIAKGIYQKLETRAKKKDTGDIRPWIKSIVNHTYWVAASSGEDQNEKIHKWTSISNHIMNKHVHESDVFPQCIHGELEEQRAWLKQGKQISLNHYAPKNTHFFQYAMKARIYIAALHYNENGNRQQAVTKAGILKWKKSYPKANKRLSRA
ncbi:uncharacterized protein [Mytilus edulis]|uniref:uncharacterized protein n=1 Tax=Mytilus edulis TaxID=6550 RepID=UPI0039EE74D4